MPTKKKRVCIECDMIFFGPDKQKHCSRRCVKESHGHRLKEKTCHCGTIFFVHKHSPKNYCEGCCSQRRFAIKNCKKCDIGFKTSSRKKKYCDVCLKIVQHEAGCKSAVAQAEHRRSSNEILFADMCKERFEHVTTNDPVFEKWDADVLVWDHKIAVLWNGPWHHKKLREKHSVEQTQTRDKIKCSVIKKMGWIPIVIDDFDGKKNDLEFVKKKFEEFCQELLP